MSAQEFAVGQKVQLVDRRTGVVRFVGQTAFAPGDWVGVELDDGSGKNDGSVQGQRYFDCRMGYGMFVRPTTLTVVAQPTAAVRALPKPSAPAKKPTSRPSSLIMAPTKSALGRPSVAPKTIKPPAPVAAAASRPAVGTKPAVATRKTPPLPSSATTAPAARKSPPLTSATTTTTGKKSPPLTSAATTTARRSPPLTSGTSIKPSGPVPTASRTAAGASATTANKEIEDLKAKIRVLEKKRIEDREKINILDKVQSERDKFERIIQTLQIKYQPQQQEIADLRRQLKEAETRFISIETLQADHESAMEIATLDREMAEEMAEAYKAEVSALKEKNEELELELEILRAEHMEFTMGMSAEDRANAGWLQMEKNNDLLREALVRLRDISREKEEELNARIKDLEGDAGELESVKAELSATKEKLAQTESTVQDLREQLDNALGAEDLIESLTEQNMNQSEQIKELKASIQELEDLKELNDELEANHVQNEKELQLEIERKDSVIAEHVRQAATQKKAMEEMEYSLSKFRELVSSLQSDLEDMRASHAVTDNESEQLSSRSRAMIDLNLKLQISAAKAHVKTIDLELRHMEAEEAEQHLEIVQLYLPDSYQTDKDSVLALLRFKRVAFKANLLSGFIHERVVSSAEPGREDNVFEGCSAISRLLWISGMCGRFFNAMSHCSLEQFAEYQSSLHELEPVERALNGYIDSLRRDTLKEKQCNDDLQRTVTLMSHLGESHIPDTLESFAAELHMKARLMQSHLESAAVSVATARTMVQRSQALKDDDDVFDDRGQHFLKTAEDLVTQIRSAKVVAGKTVRALEDLMSRSLSLRQESREAFERCETSTAELADLAQRIGLDLHGLFNEEGRTDPFTFDEVHACLQKTAASAFGSEDTDLLAAYLKKVRAVTGQVADLAALSTDLTMTQEFEPSPAPWVLRSQELKALKQIPIEAEAEVRRLKDELATVRRTVVVRDMDLSTAQLKIDTLESRMRDANAKSARISELEAQVASAKESVTVLKDCVVRQDRELKVLELDRDKWKQIASSNRVVAGGAGVGEDGAQADQQQAVATAQEMDSLKTEVSGLQAALRYLRDDSRRARLVEQPDRDWLAEPLTKNVPPSEQRQASLAAESRAVLGELVNLASGATIYDMAHLPADKVAWKPAKSTPQFHRAKQMEEFAALKVRQETLVKKSKKVALGSPGSSTPIGLRFRARLSGVGHKVSTSARGEVKIVESDGTERLPGSGSFYVL